MAYHAVLAPSSAHRYLECAASAYYNKKFDDKTVENVAADQGTVAHHIAYLWFTMQIDEIGDLQGNKYVVLNGEVLSADEVPGHKGTVHVVDYQMVEGVNRYVVAVTNSYADLDKESSIIGFELKVPIHTVTHEPNAKGTSDVVMFDKNRIEVHDLKYGFVEVMARDNPQLKIYALGTVQMLIEKYVGKHPFNNDTVIRSVIHQPRVKDAPDVFDYTLGELLAWAKEKEDAFKRAYAFYLHPEVLEKSDFHYKPGEHCQYCNYAKNGCQHFLKHLSKATVEAAEVIGDRIPISNNEVLTLVRFHELKDVIKTLSQRVEEELVRRIVSGEEIPGYRLGKGREGNRKWSLSDDELKNELLNLGMNENQIISESIISPAEMSARVKQGLIDKATAKVAESMFITRAPASIKLVRENSSAGEVSSEEVKGSSENIMDVSGVL